MQENDSVERVVVQFQTRDGTKTGSQIDIPVSMSPGELQELINGLLQNEDDLPYSFYLNDLEVVTLVGNHIEKEKVSTESVIPIIYEPQAIFRVNPVTRCSSTLPGHEDAVTIAKFSPDGRRLATGSGDCTIRLWDLNTELPHKTMRGHKSWLLALEWSPLGTHIASGDMKGNLIFWNPDSGKATTKPIQAHAKWITSIAWEPMHLNPKCVRVASASKDGLIKIWRADTRRKITLGGHKDAVKCIRWGGEGFIYSAGQDRLIRVWETKKGKCIRTLKGHAHWVNHLSLNTDYAIRTGPFNYKGKRPKSDEEALKECLKRYNDAKDVRGELVVSASDDFTLFLWNPGSSPKPVARMTGHQQLVNHVCFSPDGRLIASASFDKSIRIWDGLTGKFVCTMRGHVAPVYQVCWSGDSRILVSGSKDTTLKLWSMKTRKQLLELPGHFDEVFAVDWSPDGKKVASGGKDTNVKIWCR